jgi:hypothetical protein
MLIVLWNFRSHEFESCCAGLVSNTVLLSVLPLVQLERATRSGLQRQLEAVECELVELRGHGHSEEAVVAAGTQAGTDTANVPEEEELDGTSTPAAASAAAAVSTKIHPGIAGGTFDERIDQRTGSGRSPEDEVHSAAAAAAAAILKSRQALLRDRSKQRDQRIKALLLLKSRCQQGVEAALRSITAAKAERGLSSSSQGVMADEIGSSSSSGDSMTGCGGRDKSRMQLRRQQQQQQQQLQQSVDHQVAALLLLAAGLRRNVMELEGQLSVAVSQAELRGRKEELYRMEASDLGVQVQLLAQHVQDLEVGCTSSLPRCSGFGGRLHIITS